MDHLVLSPVGSILKSHGLKGAVLLKRGSLKIEQGNVPKVLWLGESAQVARPWTVDYLEICTKSVYLKLREINSRQEADFLNGLRVFIPEVDIKIPETTEIIGYKVKVNQTSVDCGVIQAIDESNLQPLYIVQTKSGKILVPAVAELIERIDHAHQTVVFKDIEGLFPL